MTKDLVIIRAGARSLHPFWKEPKSTPPWDIYVCPYQETPPWAPMEGVTIGEVMPGPKWTGIRQLLNSWDGWRDYRYIMLADDDLLMTEASVTNSFAHCVAVAASLAQPALTEGSYSGHLLVYRNTAFLHRLVTFVEIMLPTFRSEVLSDMLWTLDLMSTGWGFGLDALWPKLLDYKGVYIIDAEAVAHTRPVGQMRDLDLQMRVQAEAMNILKRYDSAFIRRTIAGRTLDGTVLFQTDPRLLYTLLRGYDGIFQRQPRLLRTYLEQQTGMLGESDMPDWMRR